MPERAVDGNNSGNYNDGSITHTTTQTEPWWQVDLGQLSSIDYIEVWNRTGYENRLSDFVIFVTEDDPTNRSYTDLLNDPSVWQFSFAGVPLRSTQVPVGSIGRFIRVQLPGDNRVLSLAEVIITGSSERPQVSDCDDMTALMASPDLNCTNAGCHSATPSQAARISLTGSLEQVAARLGDVESVNSACNGEKVIDLTDPSNSLLLKLIDPSTDSACSTKMPIGSPALSAEHYQCFVQWVEDVVAAAPVIEEPGTPPVFEPVNALSALNKTKSLIQGGAITDTEFNNLTFSGTEVNRDALKSAIDNWINTPEFEIKFKSFLNLALQQDNVNPDGGYRLQFDGIGRNSNDIIDGTAFLENIEEFFVRTAYKIFTEGRDFRNIATTREWEVTTAVLLGLVYTDNEGRWPGGGGGIRKYPFLLDDSDYTDWRTVTLTQGSTPATFDHTEDIAANLRNIPDGGNLALVAPRVGYFTTPVFLQSWETNVGNKFRVTINQTMIAGLGLTFEAGDVTPHGNLAALDTQHAGPQNPECFACHRMLDPMKQVFDNQYSLNRGIRGQAIRTNISSSFAFHGFETELNSIDDLGQAIFNHPNFAAGWVAKLCNWATSAPCDEDGAEFKRLVNVFKNSGHNMRALVIELFASPLITGSEYIDEFDASPPSIVLNRTNHFCTTMQARLNQVRASQGLSNSPRADICNLSNNSRSKAALLPQDEYARGAIDLIQSVSFDPFISTGYLQLCESVINQIVNHGAGRANPDSIFDANQVARTLDELVTYVMGIPPTSDGYTDAREALQKMYDIHRHPVSCSQQGLDPVTANANEVVCGFAAANNAVALRPVWSLVCSTPSLLGLGF